MTPDQLVEAVRKHAKTVLLPSVAQAIVEELLGADVSSTELATTAPSRAFRLTAKIEADTRPELAWALRNMADLVDRDQLAVGVIGAPDSGAIYELLTDPQQTHEKYFNQVQEYLRGEATNTGVDRPRSGRTQSYPR